ncbi:cellulose biosynthesis protein BcsS [Methylocystis heyeri]|uniref:Uncharacterized protein n=1 Tax=Methylocystis heyeri TaxID=391905 RepID=A0A6B8KIZ6_9HYPH|nr:cellulose biosynthesis protein BcsS [Methylocystis heyeri]QGM46875.1 hypothetical protein H2LOC_014895 [Methylocystis heyeri]
MKGLPGLLAIAFCVWASPAASGGAASSLEIFDSPPPLRPTLAPQSDPVRENSRAEAKIAAAVVARLDPVRLRTRIQSLDEAIARASVAPGQPGGVGTGGQGLPGEFFTQTPAIFDANRFRGLADLGAALGRAFKADPELWRLKQYWALKSGFEVDYAPSAETLFYLKSLYSPAYHASFAEIKPGFSPLDGLLPAPPLGKFYLGPFAVLAGLRRDQPMKLGLHLTLSEIGSFHVTMACGYARDRLMGSGAFGLMETSFKF